MEQKNEKMKQKVVYYYDESESENEGSDLSEIAIEKVNINGVFGRKKKLLVLGLGGLLCHRVWRKNWSDVPKHCPPDASFGSIFVYKRPYCEEFIEFCMERFEVGIWSSAKEWYLNNALDCVMGKHRNNLLFAWDQNECTYSGFDTLEKKGKPIFFKELKKLWEKTNWRKNGHYSASNTLLFDNQPYKALLNPPQTGIFLPEYKAEHANDTALGPNGELRVYLDGLAKADDVQSYVKEHPFGEPAITTMHPNWDYYDRIIRHLRVD